MKLYDALVTIDQETERNMLRLSVVAKAMGFDPAATGAALGLCRDPELAHTAGDAPVIQRRLRDFVCLLNLIEPVCPSCDDALRWFRNTPIHVLGDRTAAALFSSGQTALVLGTVRRYMLAYRSTQPAPASARASRPGI